MKRLIFMTGLSALLIGAVGCKSPVCNSCQNCGPGGHGGLVGGVDPGCHPGPLGWQQGGLDYSPALSRGHYAHGAGAAGAAGMPSAQVAYPYYTVRGPRDFLLDDPPPIGN